MTFEQRYGFTVLDLISMAVCGYESGYLTRYGVAVDVERILEDYNMADGLETGGGG
jgi:hypothetical protein